MRRALAAIIAAAGLLALAPPAPSSAQAPADGKAAAPPNYLPGLGDLMTMTVQPRHIKLAMAGREKNWTYAAYELHELEEAFDRVARVWPQWRSVPIAELIASATKDPIAALAQAIKAADGDRFAAAYAQLTDTCNACHQAANRGVIVIRVPEASSFPDQDFRPTKP